MFKKKRTKLSRLIIANVNPGFFGKNLKEI